MSRWYKIVGKDVGYTLDLMGSAHKHKGCDKEVKHWVAWNKNQNAYLR